MTGKITLSMLALILAANISAAVEYRDYDAATGSFTNAVRECTLVTGGTTEFADGA